MGVENTRYAVVNLSSTKIPVYSSLVHSSIHTGAVTAGGSVIGHIHPNEFYTVIPNSSMYVTSFKIYFIDGNNTKRYGYIETSPGTTLGYHSWNSKQYPYHYYNSNGSSLVSSKTTTIGGSTYRVFTVTRTINCLTPSGGFAGDLKSGTQIACKSSTTGKNNPGFMVFYYKRTSSSASWTKIHSSSNYVFVNLDIGHGALPNNRAVR